MKVKSVTIRNIGKIAETKIDFNQPLLIFYGEIQQGKTTILNAIRFVFGGSFPADIIRHGAEEGSVVLEFDTGSITREVYRARDGSTKARPIVFIRDGRPVQKPVQEIEKFLNPFLLDQDFLRNKTELERKRFFVELFGVNTADFDAEIEKSEQEARALRAKLTGYGEINLTPVEPVDVAALEAQLKKINDEHETAVEAVRKRNESAQEHNRMVPQAEESLQAWIRETVRIEGEIQRLKAELVEANRQASEISAWIKANPAKPLELEPAAPNTQALKEQISNAKATNVRHEQYLADKKRAEQKQADQRQLAFLETTIRLLREKKIAKLAELSQSSGIPGLTFDESGDFCYHGTAAGMLSTSQIMQLSSELSAKYPAGFGLDLIDRGESLGKSIFDFVKRAQAEEKTILATVVGEKPAEIPEHVGVFVVENGAVKQS
jgi:hypothetical protein